MDFQQMQERARAIRAQYAEVEASTYGRSWTITATMDELEGILSEDE